MLPIEVFEQIVGARVVTEQAAAGDGRATARVPLAARASISVAGRNVESAVVRDVSRSGLSVVVRRVPLAVGTPLVVHLPRAGGGTVAVPCVVARCERVGGRKSAAYLVGAEFGEAAAGTAAATDPMTTAAERAEAARIRRAILD